MRYNANGGKGTMADTKVVYGVQTNLRENTFTRNGYVFDCWYVQRESDSKWRYRSADKTASGWYLEGAQPTGWVKYPYVDGGSVSKTVSQPGGKVFLYAQWTPST